MVYRLSQHLKQTAPTAAMDHDANSGIPKVSRKWSDEAVRGSVESSFYRSSSGSPAQEEAAPQTDDNTNPNLIDEWLSHQETEDPSTMIDAVSDLVTPISSPTTSVDSATFATQQGLHRPTVESLMPAASSSRPVKSSTNTRISPREPTPQSTAQDLLGVGAFAEPSRPRYAPIFILPLLYNANLSKLIQDRR